jgi:hypothetical protein
MPEITEHHVQRAVCIWLDGQPGRGRLGALVPGVVYWHTPNGGTRRDAFEGKRLQELGLKAGVHDLLFLRWFPGEPFGRLFGLEFKRPGGRLSPAQLAMHPRMCAAGLAGSATVDNLDDAKAQLIAWGLAYHVGAV